MTRITIVWASSIIMEHNNQVKVLTPDPVAACMRIDGIAADHFQPSSNPDNYHSSLACFSPQRMDLGKPYSYSPFLTSATPNRGVMFFLLVC